MDSDAKWLSQRITLLKNHLQELKELLLREKIERQQLIQQHRHHVSIVENNPLTKAAFVIEHTHQLTVLSIHFSKERKRLLTGQKQDEIVQDEQINLERHNQSSTH